MYRKNAPDKRLIMKKINSNSKYSLAPQPKLRTKKAEFMLNEDEYNLICFYLKKYKISNRSRWFRETVISHVLRNMEQDYPTLFEENEMRR